MQHTKAVKAGGAKLFLPNSERAVAHFGVAEARAAEAPAAPHAVRPTANREVKIRHEQQRSALRSSARQRCAAPPSAPCFSRAARRVPQQGRAQRPGLDDRQIAGSEPL